MGGGGGEGGLFGLDHQTIVNNSKTALFSTSKLGDILFYPLDTFWQNFRKIDSPGRLLQLF